MVDEKRLRVSHMAYAWIGEKTARLPWTRGEACLGVSQVSHLLFWICMLVLPSAQFVKPRSSQVASISAVPLQKKGQATVKEAATWKFSSFPCRPRKPPWPAWGQWPHIDWQKDLRSKPLVPCLPHPMKFLHLHCCGV
ncbi:hypothetical protein N657DRAFT_384064 [Parathielavia appendiculata]|uniref:Uncharacterized protein n=1 Tax=Parathielavia appendiculata TaxID=2587402 RepID=A0AAN6Z468_9PEZI|nr:hypothetical protein N657DRAFT_384064 [Parathielavia appendiculata]